MNEIREIVTKAVVGKGKKLMRFNNTLVPTNDAFSILGCWIINHEFDASLDNNNVVLNGVYEIHVWYAYNNNTETDIAKHRFTYQEIIKTRQIVKEVSNNRDVLVQLLEQPRCTNASIVDNSIEVDVIMEALAEIIGETKMVVTVFTNIDTNDSIDDFENEVNEDFINESKIVS